MVKTSDFDDEVTAKVAEAIELQIWEFRDSSVSFQAKQYAIAAVEAMTSASKSHPRFP